MRVDLVDPTGWAAGERSAGREQEADARHAPLHLERAGAQQHMYGATGYTTWARLLLTHRHAPIRLHYATAALGLPKSDSLFSLVSELQGKSGRQRYDRCMPAGTCS